MKSYLYSLQFPDLHKYVLLRHSINLIFCLFVCFMVQFGKWIEEQKSRRRCQNGKIFMITLTWSFSSFSQEVNRVDKLVKNFPVAICWKKPRTLSMGSRNQGVENSQVNYFRRYLPNYSVDLERVVLTSPNFLNCIETRNYPLQLLGGPFSST